ncbi:hypothetical protein L873DRAFT_1799759 [Choiromyces venosus 120613-1]|uniref:Uncharacterized protein n=1 Tax=Choiromyces venosus 120613-1 TaxID=1336337 RepID=A0A3N4K1T4_9PEZI|nr:hypothetical protein L873DRAFT_1799759 [Choiromyces venosus 120613-1]
MDWGIGHVLAVTDEVPTGAIEKSKRNRPVEDEGGKGEVKVFKGLANFDEVMVWGHDVAPEEGGEYVVKGMNEWIGLASKVCVLCWSGVLRFFFFGSNDLQIHSFEDEEDEESK